MPIGIPYFEYPKQPQARNPAPLGGRTAYGAYVSPRSSNSPASDLYMHNTCAHGHQMSIFVSAPGADLTLDPTESESTTQDMHGIAEQDRESRGEQVMQPHH
jgi:hypothetical protein